MNTENYDGFEPITSFEAANLNEKIMNNIRLCGYEKPTPIQVNPSDQLRLLDSAKY